MAAVVHVLNHQVQAPAAQPSSPMSQIDRMSRIERRIMEMERMHSEMVTNLKGVIDMQKKQIAILSEQTKELGNELSLERNKNNDLAHDTAKVKGMTICDGFRAISCQIMGWEFVL